MLSSTCCCIYSLLVLVVVCAAVGAPETIKTSGWYTGYERGARAAARFCMGIVVQGGVGRLLVLLVLGNFLTVVDASDDEDEDSEGDCEQLKSTGGPRSGHEAKEQEDVLHRPCIDIT